MKQSLNSTVQEKKELECKVAEIKAELSAKRREAKQLSEISKEQAALASAAQKRAAEIERKLLAKTQASSTSRPELILPSARAASGLEHSDISQLVLDPEFSLVQPTPPGLDALFHNPPKRMAKGKERVYQSTSLFCLHPGIEPRRSFIMLVEQPAFDAIILLTILMNCFTMAWASPLDPPGTWKANFIATCEWAYLTIFTFELVSKIIAYGFLLNPTAYLKDPWCQLDFVVVSLAWMPICFPSFGNYPAIRSARALRPLRALKRVPGMPVLVNSILTALPPLGNVAALFGALFFIFGIIGMELFKGSLHYRCAEPGFFEVFRRRPISAYPVAIATRLRPPAGSPRSSAHA